MANLFLSPCGTSILTNNIDSELRGLLFKTANHQENDLTPDEKSKIAQHIEARKQMILDFQSLAEIKKISAELNGILSYYKDQIPQGGQPDIHYILVSDTYQGRAVGDIIVQWLQLKGLQADIISISDLATGNKDSFRLAMSELVIKCEEIINFIDSTL